MFKKILIILSVCFLSCVNVHALENNVTPNAGATILIEANSRQILYSNKEAERMYPASTTKIMTMILLFEAIHNNDLKWTDKITTSEYAASMGGSQVYLEVGEKMSVKDMFKAIAIASANDASVAVAEEIGGNIEKFVSMMNQKAEDLGLINTHFANATGLHDSDHYTCALDLALMAAYLIEIGGEELLSVTSLYDSYIREDSDQSFWLVNTNKLLKQYDGVDGLKTGFTKEAGYCLVTTATKNDLRLIGVVLNETDPKTRNQEMCNLLDYGFKSYQRIILYKKNSVVDTININHTNTKNLDVICKEDIVYLQTKEKEKTLKEEIIYNKKEPPIKQGEKIGEIHLYLDDLNVATYSLYSKENVGTENYFGRLIEIFKGLF